MTIEKTQFEHDMVDYYRFWYAAYAYRAELCNLPFEDGEDIHWYNYREYVDILKKEARCLFENVVDARHILLTAYNEGDIFKLAGEIAEPELFHEYLHMESGEFCLMNYDGPNEDTENNAEADKENTDVDTGGLPAFRESDFCRLAGPAKFQIDVSIPIESLVFYFKELQNTRFLRPFFKVPQFLDEGALEYNIAYHILKRIKHIRFSANTSYPRAIGLWIWDQVHLKKIFPNVLRAVRALRNHPQEYGLPEDLIEQLGYADSSDTQFSRMCSATKQCIEAREVLKMA